MPLMKGKSEKAFKKNIKTEYEEGKPLKQSLAIAYAMKRKGKKMAKGGAVHGSGCTCSQCMEHMDQGGMASAQKSLRDAFGTKPSPTPAKPTSEDMAQIKVYGHAEGGMIKDNYQPSGKPEVDKEFSYEPAEKDSGYMMHEGDDVKSNGPAMHESEKKLNQHAVDMMASTSMSEQDMVDRIMKKRSENFSGLDRYSEGGEIGVNKPVNPAHTVGAGKGESKAGDYARWGMAHEMSNNSAAASRDYEKAKKEHGKTISELRSMPNPKLKGLSEGGKVANQEHGENNNELAGFSPNEFDDLVLRDDLESTYGDDDNSGDNLGNAQEDEDRKDIVSRIMASRKKKDRMPNPA